MSSKILCHRLEDDHRIAIVTLNNPERLNAVSPDMLALLLETLGELDDDPECRAVILTGAGRGFCAGLDLSALTASGSSNGGGRTAQRLMADMRRTWTRVLPRLRAMRPVVIAAVNGPAAGGGFVLSLGADIRFATPTATFHDAFVKVGVSGCELGLSWILPRLIGAAAAWEMMLTGRIVSANEAREMGLVFRVVESDQLLAVATAKAREVLTNTPFGVWMTREVMWSSLESPSLQAAIELETRTQVLGLMTEDQKEQLAAFMEKRAPSYRND